MSQFNSYNIQVELENCMNILARHVLYSIQEMKAERLLAILSTLLNRRQVSAAELAKRHEVSVRTIYRDIDALSSAGFPVYATSGRQGGISLIEGFKLSQRLLSTKDLQKIISALDSIQGIYPEWEVDELKEKLGTLLAESEKHGVASPSKRIFIEMSPSSHEKEIIDQLDDAIGTSQVTEISYRDANGVTTVREIEALALVCYWHSWYVYAWCRLRKDFRNFRVARIGYVKTLDKARSDPPAELSDRPWQKEWAPEVNEDVGFVFEEEALSRVEDFFDPELIRKNPDGTYRIDIRGPKGEWIFSWLIGLPGTVQILYPEYLKEKMHAKAKRLAEKNK